MMDGFHPNRTNGATQNRTTDIVNTTKYFNVRRKDIPARYTKITGISGSAVGFKEIARASRVAGLISLPSQRSKRDRRESRATTESNWPHAEDVQRRNGLKSMNIQALRAIFS